MNGPCDRILQNSFAALYFSSTFFILKKWQIIFLFIKKKNVLYRFFFPWVPWSWLGKNNPPISALRVFRLPRTGLTATSWGQVNREMGGGQASCQLVKIAYYVNWQIADPSVIFVCLFRVKHHIVVMPGLSRRSFRSRGGIKSRPWQKSSTIGKGVSVCCCCCF